MKGLGKTRCDTDIAPTGLGDRFYPINFLIFIIARLLSINTKWTDVKICLSS